MMKYYNTYILSFISLLFLTFTGLSQRYQVVICDTNNGSLNVPILKVTQPDSKTWLSIVNGTGYMYSVSAPIYTYSNSQLAVASLELIDVNDTNSLSVGSIFYQFDSNLWMDINQNWEVDLIGGLYFLSDSGIDSNVSSNYPFGPANIYISPSNFIVTLTNTVYTNVTFTTNITPLLLMNSDGSTLQNVNAVNAVKVNQYDNNAWIYVTNNTGILTYKGVGLIIQNTSSLDYNGPPNGTYFPTGTGLDSSSNWYSIVRSVHAGSFPNDYFLYSRYISLYTNNSFGFSGQSSRNQTHSIPDNFIGGGYGGSTGTFTLAYNYLDSKILLNNDNRYLSIPTILNYSLTNAPNYSDGAFRKCAMTGDMTLYGPTNTYQYAIWTCYLTAPSYNVNLYIPSPVLIPSDSGFTSPKLLTANLTYIVQMRYGITASSTNWVLNSVVGGY